MTPDGEPLSSSKQPFAIDVALQRVREAVRPYPRAMLFELYDAGRSSPFEVLVACLISIRTRDEISLVMARRLFEVAHTPAEVAALDVDHIDRLIGKCAFHLAKAEQIKTLARLVVEEHAGALPCSFEVMTSFPGVGPKCANLALGIACGQARIGVDIHVHRITNRWGYVSTRSPDATRAALEARLPRPYWVDINALLVPFGKHVCTPVAPRCGACPLLEMCQQRGVTTHR